MKRRGEERVVLIGLCTAPSMRIINFLFSPQPALRPSLCPHMLLSLIPCSVFLSLFVPFVSLYLCPLTFGLLSDHVSFRSRISLPDLFFFYYYYYLLAMFWLLLLLLNKYTVPKSNSEVNLSVNVYFRPSLSVTFSLTHTYSYRYTVVVVLTHLFCCAFIARLPLLVHCSPLLVAFQLSPCPTKHD